MREFYERFYAVVPSSPAHALFCERAFGLDLGQHGFANMAQLDALVEATNLCTAPRVLGLGCGDGRITEYLSDRTGAHLTGLDYIPEAIRLARERTAAKADRLAFVVGDLNALDLPVWSALASLRAKAPDHCHDTRIEPDKDCKTIRISRGEGRCTNKR